MREVGGWGEIHPPNPPPAPHENYDQKKPMRNRVNSNSYIILFIKQFFFTIKFLISDLIPDQTSSYFPVESIIKYFSPYFSLKMAYSRINY